MGVIYTPPTKIEESDFINYMVFLAGSIEMGVAEDWQTTLSKELVDIPKLTILNPRRPQWDNSWVQSLDNPIFKEQVDWELDGIEKADLVIFYFDPNTKSPITLLELGMVSQLVRLEKRIIVCCPNGFYRKGNVDIVVHRMRESIRQNPFFPKDGFVSDYVMQAETLEELLDIAKRFLKYKTNL